MSVGSGQIKVGGKSRVRPDGSAEGEMACAMLRGRWSGCGLVSCS
jgi:hypothetical protein